MKDFNSVEYKRSRKAYMVQCTTEYFISLLVTDAFLSKLLTNIGISDSLIGIISSFISVAFVIQLMSIFLVRSKISTKKIVVFFDTISIFFFMLLYFVPFMPIPSWQKTAIVVVSIFLAYACKYLISSICYKWANSYVEPTERAVYSAYKEIISLASGMIFTAVIGFIIDKYESLGNINGGFLFIATSMLILNIANLICLLMIKKEETDEKEESNVPVFEAVKNTFSNKSFRSIVVLTILWDVSRYFTAGFMGVFKTNDLMLSVFFIQLINIMANALRMLISVPIGNYSKKTSYAKGFKVGLYLAAGAFFVNIFTTKSTWFFVIAHTLLYQAAFAGTNQNSFNITYSYVDEKYITHAMAFKNSIGGIMGFLASLVGGKLVSVIQANGNQIFGINMYAQQLTSLISFILVIVSIVYIKVVIEKQSIKVQ